MTRGQDFEKHFLSLSANAFLKYFGSSVSQSLLSSIINDKSQGRNNNTSGANIDDDPDWDDAKYKDNSVE
jgi:hypothetical protein